MEADFSAGQGGLTRNSDGDQVSAVPTEKDFPERRFGRFQRGLTAVFP